MNDKEARDKLREWPLRPNELWRVPGGSPHWLRAWPKKADDSVKSVLLGPPSAVAYRTRPDGLWISRSKKGLADVFCVEHCGTIQNLHDKRSRYGPSTASIVAVCPREWLGAHLTKTLTRAAYLGFGRLPTNDVPLPVRHLRVLYVIPDSTYDKWARYSAPSAHEFFCKHASLGSYKSQKMQEFLRAMSPMRQLYTTPSLDEN